MIVATLLAACLVTPFFPSNWTGATCTTARQGVECGCSECMTWDVALDAEWYEVLRTNPDATTFGVGNTRDRNRDEVPAYLTGDGLLILPIPAEIVRTWCYPWDSPHPTRGALYDYRVRGCRPPRAGETADVCGPTTTIVQYRAAPYACFQVGNEVACYAGDPVVTP